MKAKWQNDIRRILLGDDTSCRAAMLELMEFQSGGDCISTGFHCMYTYFWPHIHSQFRLELNSTCAGSSGRQGAWARASVCAYLMKNTVFWIVTTYSLENLNQNFGGTKCLCFLPRRYRQWFLPIVTTRHFSTHFNKCLEYKITRISTRPVEAKFIHADRRTGTNGLIGNFHQFSIAPWKGVGFIAYNKRINAYADPVPHCVYRLLSHLFR